MAQIIHLAAGEKPEFDRTYCVYEWQPGGVYSVELMPGIGSWYHVPEALFDSLLVTADATADRLGHERVYIIGRPK